MQTHCQMGQPDRFHHRKDHGAGNRVSGRVFAMRVIGTDVEVGEVARAGAQRRGYSGQQRAAGRGDGGDQRGRGSDMSAHGAGGGSKDGWWLYFVCQES